MRLQENGPRCNHLVGPPFSLASSILEEPCFEGFPKHQHLATLTGLENDAAESHSRKGSSPDPVRWNFSTKDPFVLKLMPFLTRSDGTGKFSQVVLQIN